MNKDNYGKKDIPIIKTFIHNGKYFLYDTYSNRLFGISKDQYIEVSDLQEVGIEEYISKSKNTNQYRDVIMLIDKGLLKQAFIDEIRHPETDYVEYLVERCINDLTLQVTRNCNFSCRYCLYASEGKVERTHEAKNMSYETAIDCINFLYNHSLDANEVIIAFYGGEPLLNFNLIKDCVEYANKLFHTKNVKYVMTINGSLLNDIIREFLIRNEFNLTISLDGPEDIQNQHRKFLHRGDSTFDIVFSNILKLREENNSYFNNNVHFLPVLFDDESYYSMMEFFRKLDVEESKVNPTYAALRGIDYIASNAVRYDTDPASIEEAKRIVNKTNEDTLRQAYSNKSSITEKWHHGGPCVPAAKRLFADIHGKFYPCEKIVEHENFAIGDIKNGLDINRIIEFMNIGELTKEDCKACWAMRFCNICISSCNDFESNVISAEQKKVVCAQHKRNALSFLKREIETQDAN
jgi:uncharacterized protein